MLRCCAKKRFLVVVTRWCLNLNISLMSDIKSWLISPLFIQVKRVNYSFTKISGQKDQNTWERGHLFIWDKTPLSKILLSTAYLSILAKILPKKTHKHWKECYFVSWHQLTFQTINIQPTHSCPHQAVVLQVPSVFALLHTSLCRQMPMQKGHKLITLHTASSLCLQMCCY